MPQSPWSNEIIGNGMQRPTPILGDLNTTPTIEPPNNSMLVLDDIESPQKHVTSPQQPMPNFYNRQHPPPPIQPPFKQQQPPPFQPYNNHPMNQPAYNPPPQPMQLTHHQYNPPQMPTPMPPPQQIIINPIADLINYCSLKNYPLPRLRLQTNKNANFGCCVHFNGTVYSTYPDEYSLPNLAKNVAANRALEYIKMESIYQNEDMDPIADLIQYCKSKNYPIPLFTMEKEKYASGTFTCSVRVNNATYTTFPLEYETRCLAKDASAKKALQCIKLQEGEENSLTDTVDKLHRELLKYPDGFYTRNLAKLFNIKFKQCLPYNILAIIKNSSLFTLCFSSTYIYANNYVEEIIERTEPTRIDPIILPWSDEYWNILITHYTSMVDIWGRLIGADYNVRFDTLVSDIEAHMKTNKEHPVAIASKNICLANIDECWHRVRVEKLDNTKGSALCFFIDGGRAEWLIKDQLYICETQFLSLPAQAVPFSLYGLEDLEGHPHERACLVNYLENKSLIGRIHTKEHAFYDKNSKNHGKIQVLLFKTFAQEHVNLNDLLWSDIWSKIFVPKIEYETKTVVILTHITEQNDIYLQVKSPELEYLKKLIHKVIETKLKRNQGKITFRDLKRSKLFLICDDHNPRDIKWYRASCAETIIWPDSEYYAMYFIDFGITKSIYASKIFALDRLSTVLCKFPAQAIKVRLGRSALGLTLSDIRRIRKRKNCDAIAILSTSKSVLVARLYPVYILL